MHVVGKGGKKPKTAKGHHASRNAYMLVYVQRSEKPDIPTLASTKIEDIPAQLRKFVEQDNKKLEEWINDMKKTRVGFCDLRQHI